jgi:hypothetical protein
MFPSELQQLLDRQRKSLIILAREGVSTRFDWLEEEDLASEVP